MSESKVPPQLVQHQFQPRRSPTYDCTPEEARAIASRLKYVFDLVDDVMRGDKVREIWAVHGVAGGEAPRAVKLESREELYDLINQLRVKHNAEPDNDYYVHIFHGSRWQIQKGRTWKLWDGNRLDPIESDNAQLEFLDLSGGLGDQPDLDQVLPPRDDEPEPVVEEEPLEFGETPVLGEVADEELPVEG